MGLRLWRCKDANRAFGSCHASLLDYRNRKHVLSVRSEQKDPETINRSASKASRRARYLRVSRLLALPHKRWVNFKCTYRASFERSLTA